MSTSHPAFTLLAAFALAGAVTAQSILHVSSAAGGPGSGTAADPFASIQTAINAAAAGDTVLVGPGTYSETIDFGGVDVVVRSALGAGATTIDAAANGHVARFVSGETTAAVLEGFTLENGSATSGGGITCEAASSPTIRRCIIRDNSAVIAGGGVHVNGSSSPTFFDCDIVDNFAAVSGGGLVADSTGLRLERCRIVGNVAGTGGGGGLSIAGSTGVVVVDSSFEANSAGADGGALDLFGTTLTLERSRLAGNSALNGGAIHSFNSSPTLIRCELVANAATMSGGGIYSAIGAPDCRDSVFLDNTAGSGGGLFELGGSSTSLVGCTLTGNAASTGGGVDFLAAGSPVYANSVIWGNSPDGIAPFSGASLSVSHCDVQGGIAGPGNIDADPMFVDVAGADVSLAAGSPCLDAGSSAHVTTSADLEGNPRVVGPDVDMGADERVIVLAGTGDDMSLAVLVDGRDGDVRTKPVNPGEALRFEIGTPGGTFSGIPPAVLGQAFPPAMPPAGPLPELHLDFPGLLVFFDGSSVPAPFGPVTLERDAFALNAVAPMFGGTVVRFQVAITTPLANNTIYAISDAFDLVFP